MGQETKFFFQKIWLSGASLAVDKHWRTVADSYHVWADAYVGAAQFCGDPKVQRKNALNTGRKTEETWEFITNKMCFSRIL